MIPTTQERPMHRVNSPDNSDHSIESLIQAKGKTAPRITPMDITAAIIAEQFYVFPGSQLTVCCLTLRNGFTVTGESACASPENFDREIGERVSRDKAKDKIWPLLGYALKERLFQAAVKEAVPA